MRKLMIATAVAATAAGAFAAAPAIAAPYGSLAMVGAAAGRADMSQIHYRYRHHRSYRATHYGGRARGESGLPLGHGTANSPGGVVGGKSQ